MSNCKLEALPKELATVTSLKALVASHNQLTSPSLTHLAGLVDLNSLILSDNELTSLPSSIITLKSLKKLSLANNKLRSDSFPDITPLKALEEIRINGNAGIASVPEGLTNLPVLSVLELSNTGISAWTEVEKLKECTALVNLGLKSSPLASDADYNEKATTTLPKLRILDNNRFDPKFLQRKEKLKAKQAAEAGEITPLRSKQKEKKERAAGRKQAEKATSALSAKQIGKQKATDQDEEPALAEESKEKPQILSQRAKKRKRNEERTTKTAKPLSEAEPTVMSDDEAVEPAEVASNVPKKKRSRVRKRLEKQAAAEAAKSNGDDGVAQTPSVAKQIGGSLSAPAEVEAEKPEKEDLAEDLLKARSSVIGIVEANKGAKKNKGKQATAGEGRDVLSLLQQATPDSDVVSGWD